jgi:hypothetical protein
MSASILLTCDSCKAVAHGEKTVRGSRAKVRPLGWSNPVPGIDQCSACTRAKAESAKADPHPGYF